MRVAFDLTPLRSGNTGVARYARDLHDEIRRSHPDVELRTLTIGRGLTPDVPIDRHFGLPLRVTQRLWDVVGLPRAEHLVGPVDVVHAMDMVPPPSKRPTVLTIHDVLPLRLPERYGPRYQQVAERQAKAARERVDMVIADCQASADDIVRVLGIPADRVAVAPLGHRPVPEVVPEPLVSGPYLLYVGAITPRKGLHRLVEALLQLPPPPATPPLVVAGPDGWAAEEVHAAIAALDVPDDGRLRVLGRVSDSELDRLYAHATLLCHPSEAEGFGIPVLEAMAFGVPVVAGDIPTVREIGDGTIHLVPPHDVAALAGAIGSVLADPGGALRLVALAKVRAADFSYAACAARTVEVYRKVKG